MSRLLRYATVGAFATTVHYAVLIALVELGRLPAWIASGVGAIVGAQVAYLGNRRLTFDHRGSVARSWPSFQATAVAGAVFGMAIVALAQRVGLHYLWGQALATLLAMLLTYAINRRWAFGATRNPD